MWLDWVKSQTYLNFQYEASVVCFQQNLNFKFVIKVRKLFIPHLTLWERVVDKKYNMRDWLSSTYRHTYTARTAMWSDELYWSMKQQTAPTTNKWLHQPELGICRWRLSIRRSSSALATERVCKGLCWLTESQTLYSFQVEQHTRVMSNRSLIQHGWCAKSETPVCDV